jgi:hypothetical protein
MAQVQSPSPFLHRNRDGGILSPNSGHVFFESVTADSSVDFGLLKKRRLSYEEDEEHGDLRMNDCIDIWHPAKTKRFRTQGVFAMQSGNPTVGLPNIGPNRNITSDLDPLDHPQFSARNFEQTIVEIRSECNQRIAAKDDELRVTVESLMRDLNKAQNENRILKRAVNIQSTRCKELEVQLGRAQEQAVSITAFAKRVEQENYALGMRVQQMGQYGGINGSNLMEHRPPDVLKFMRC